jgi:hypothetical protein
VAGESDALKASAEGPDGAGILDDKIFWMGATEGNSTTQDTGGFDDLLGLSFSGFNPTPSTTIQGPSSPFSPSTF